MPVVCLTHAPVRAALVASSLLVGLVATRTLHAQQACFERIDSGVDMSGWHPSATNHHGPGAGWTVESGALVGRQTGSQQGGILMTDKLYADVEVVFQVKVDWGCDSGFFFRTTAGDRAYQVNVDHLAESGVGTIYGESFAQELRAIPYWLTSNGSTAIVAPDQDKIPIFDLASWPTIWKPTDFNEIRARVEGNPPHMQVWISGTKVMDFTDAMTRSEIDAMGPLAIQVHSGGRWIENGSVAFKNIRVKDLKAPCEDPGSGGAGGAGGSAAGGGGGSAAGSGGMAAGGQPGGGAAGTPSASGGGAGGTPPLVPVAGTSSLAGGATTPSAPESDDGCSCSSARSSDAQLGGALALLGLVGVGLSRRPVGRRRP